ncbi:sulfatase-like hydrolase/transferase [bacterium]|nr:sulfatase-like hydrolase/transferase [bacterium]
MPTPLSRRQFVQFTGASALAAWAHGAPAKGRRPNVLFIVTDDQALNAFGFIRKKALTPHIDRLAAEGVYLSRAYASSSVCTPSRFTCLTGRFASRCANPGFQRSASKEGQTLVQWNTSLESERWTLPRVLKQAGYRTGIVGKWHNGAPPGWGALLGAIPRDGDPADAAVAKALRDMQTTLHEWVKTLGFDYAASMNQGNFGAHPCRALRVHNQDWITKGALDFIDANRENPFFLYMATSLLHGPKPVDSLKADPRKTHGGLLDAPLTVQPSRESVLKRAKAAGVPEALAGATWLDDGIGAVLTRIDALDRDTLVIYFNDHGVESAKGSCYEGGVRSPAIVRWTGTIPPARSDALVGNIDFAPTILAACGVMAPEAMHVDGVDLLPILKGEKKSLRDSVYLEIGHTRAVCTERWKYIAFRIPPSRRMTKEQRIRASERYAEYKKQREDRAFEMTPGAPLSHMGFPGGQNTERGNALRKHRKTYYDADQLYDLTKDPDEQTNLAADPAHKATLERMQALLRERLKAVPGTFAEFKT